MLPDRFRKQPATLSEAQQVRVLQIKSAAAVLEAIFCEASADTACMSQAMIRLEESVMWATKGITAP